MAETVAPFHQVFPALVSYWAQDSEKAEILCKQYIAYHVQFKQEFQALLYRCVFVHLKYGRSTVILDGMGLSEKQLKEEVGV